MPLIVVEKTAAIPFHGNELGAIDWDALSTKAQNAISTVGPALIDLKTQSKLAKINMELVRQGKDPIDPNSLPGGVRASVGMDQKTLNMIYLLGGAALLILAVFLFKKK